MNKYIFSAFAIVLLAFNTPASAQVGIWVGPGRPYHRRRPQVPPPPPFQPSVDLSVGYGFPNLDKYEMPVFFNQYQGNTSQMMGPIAASLDYHFMREIGIGIMVTHGTLTLPYYNYSDGAKAYTGTSDNWSVMLDVIHYLPVNYYNDDIV